VSSVISPGQESFMFRGQSFGFSATKFEWLKKEQQLACFKLRIKKAKLSCTKYNSTHLLKETNLALKKSKHFANFSSAIHRRHRHDVQD